MSQARIGMQIDVAGATNTPFVLPDARSNDLMIYTTTDTQRLLFGIGTGHPSTVQIDARGLSAASASVATLQVAALTVGQKLSVTGRASMATLTTTGGAALRESVALGGDLAVRGNVAVGGSHTVASDARVGGSMVVTGDLSCLGRLSLANPPPRDANLMVNGDARIDQRSGGRVRVVSSTTSCFVVDRFVAAVTGAGSISAQRVDAWTTPPPHAAGFPPASENCQTALRIVVLTGQGDGREHASSSASVWQVVEGITVADLGWGCGWMRPAHLAFWAHASVPGTHVVCVSSGDRSRVCVLTYLLPHAAVWTHVSIVVPPDSGGRCWDDPTQDAAAMRVQWVLGASSDLTAPFDLAGSWQAMHPIAHAPAGQRPYAVAAAAVGSGRCSANGAVNMMLTPGATLMLTGMRLGVEAPSVCPPSRPVVPHATELSMCRSFYEVSTHIGVSNYNPVCGPISVQMPVTFSVGKRAAPTVVTSECTGGSVNVTAPPRALQLSADGYVLTIDVTGGPARYSTGVCLMTFDADVY